jgi:hypothetical protein
MSTEDRMRINKSSQLHNFTCLEVASITCRACDVTGHRCGMRNKTEHDYSHVWLLVSHAKLMLVMGQAGT